MRASLTRRLKFDRFLPFLVWLPELKRASVLRADFIAGLTVAMIVVPQSMAYAHLAGLPVYMGLYAAFIPSIIAVLFSSSRYLSTGPVPVSSLLTAVAIMPLAVTGSTAYLQYAILLTLMAGIIQLSLGLLRFGVVVNFLSYPVMLGFINGVAVIIACTQLSSLFGVSAINAPRYYQTIEWVLKDALVSTHWPSVGMAALTFLIILGGKKWWPRVPPILIAVVVTSTLAWFFSYEKTEVIRAEQIVSMSIQKMLASQRHYPEEMKQLLQTLNAAEKASQNMSNTEWFRRMNDESVNRVNQAKWQLEQRVFRHNFEVGELSRIRLRRLITNDRQVVFFVDKEMTPIGQVGARQWRIANVSEEDGALTLRAGGEVVGYVPQGLPSFQRVAWDWDAVSRLFMASLVLALVGFTEAITIAKHIATKSRERLNINQELLSQGLAKCIGAFFQSMPVSGGFTRSAINYKSGAKTGASSIIAGCFVMIVLLWLTPLFYYLPYATLAAIIIVGMMGLIDFKEMRRVSRVSRSEGVISWLTFLLTVLLAPSIAQAVLLGMLLSLGLYLYETMRPRFKEIALNTEGSWVEMGDDAESNLCHLISVVRFGGSLYFANVSYFESNILRLVRTRKQLRFIILDCVGINKLDASGLEILSNLTARLREVGIQMCLTRVRQPVLTVLERGGFFDSFKSSYVYKNIEQALEVVKVSLGKDHSHSCHLV